MSYAQQLYQLQLIDSQIDAANKRLKEITAALVETEALKEARATQEQAEKNYHQARVVATDLDLEVKGLQQKITRHERRLYSGKLVNPKEAASLQDEIASTKRWLAKREEDLLEAMIEHEDAEAHFNECKQAFIEARSKWETDQAHLLQEQTELQTNAADLTQSRRNIAQFITGDDLTRYEKLRKQKRGVAVAAVNNGSCLSCGVILSSKLCQQAAADSRLYLCEGCGRIIHILSGDA